ncbi:unnamed protein product, partial [Symbiodinium necroappetens]
EWPGDQIIITHGTDTLVETACYLGNRAGNLATKRICLTGAMLPEKFVDTDAHFNMGVCFGALDVAMPGIYVNAHAASTMQSSIQVHGQDLEVTSVMQNVPRLRVQPPRSYAETSLGVESGPGRGSRSAMFTLRLHDEVMAGMGPRQGRWLKITHPVEGWVQAATRDGQDILKEVVGCRPNLRQVVTVRPASKRQTSVQAAPAAQDIGSFRENEHAENAQSRARAVEACRLLREVARLEAFGPSGTPRKSTRGVF